MHSTNIFTLLKTINVLEMNTMLLPDEMTMICSNKEVAAGRIG